MGGAAGGAVGVARASIEFDLQKLQQAVIGVRSASGQMTNAFNKAGMSATRAEVKMVSFGSAVRQLSGEMLALSVAMGGIAAIGLKTASNIQNATIQLKGMTGSLANANKLMDELRTRGIETAIPFDQMVDFAIKLLPQLQGNTKELERWLDLSRRLSVLNPKEGLTGAAFSVRETLSSKGRDLISLAERFNISRVDFRKAMDETGGDIAASMDMILNKMGVTQTTADEMAQTFTAGLSRMTDATNQLLGTAFTPMLDELTTVMETTAAWANTIRTTHPELASLGAGIIGLTAVLLPAALLIERMAAGLAIIKGSAVMGALGGTAGLAVAAVAGPIAMGKIIDDKNVRAGGRTAADAEARNLGYTTQRRARFSGRSFGDLEAERFGITPPRRTFAPSTGTDFSFLMPEPIEERTDKQLALITKWADDVQKLEADAAESRLNATESFERQRANIIEDFGRTMTRETEDWARRQSRALEDYQDSIDDVRENAARREQLAEEDFNERIEDLREDHHKRISEIEENSNARRLDLMDQHRDKIITLASNLDAKGIQEENRRFQSALKRLDRADKKAKDKANRNVRDQEGDAREAFEKQRDRAREQDQLRLDDMEEAFNDQQERAKEDRAVRLTRMKEDHDDQLTEMGEQHQRRMEQINDQEQEKRDLLDEKFTKALEKEGIHTDAWLALQARKEEDAEKLFDKFWDHMLGKFRHELEGSEGEGGLGSPRLPDDPTSPVAYAKGGPVAGTTRALLHRGEYVMNSSVVESLRSHMGNFNQNDILNAVRGGLGGGNRNTSLSISPGGIVINESQRPGVTAREVEGALMAVIGSLA